MELSKSHTSRFGPLNVIFATSRYQLGHEKLYLINNELFIYITGRLSTENSFNKLKSSLAVVSDFVIHLKSKGHLLLAYYVYMENASQFLNIESGKVSFTF